MPAALVPCPTCRRHVRRFEATCPFCTAVVPRGLVPVPNAPRRLSRAAMAVFASTLALGGCGGAVEQPADSGKDVVDDWGAMDAAYGLADTSLFDSGKDTVDDWGTMDAAYGLADTSRLDSGKDVVDDWGSIGDVYGEAAVDTGRLDSGKDVVDDWGSDHGVYGDGGSAADTSAD